jgi:hypothetical protein
VIETERAELFPVDFRDVRRFIAEHHRHNEPPIGHKFSIGLRRGDRLVGVVVASRPVGRHADDGMTIELTRVTTDGDRNACSRLYSAACRAAFAIGYRRVITFTLQSEPGSSLRAAGFVEDVSYAKSGAWGARAGQSPRLAEELRMFDQPKVVDEPKTRWVRMAP